MSNKGFAIFLAVVVLIGGLVGVVFAVGMSVGESKTDNKNQPLLNQNTDSNPAQTSLENSSETQNEVENTTTRESDRLEGANEQLDSCLKENIGMGMEELRKVQTEGTAEEQEALRAKIEKVISESNISQPPRRQGGNPQFQQILGICLRGSANSDFSGNDRRPSFSSGMGANPQLDSCLKENIGMGMEELRKVQTEGTAEEQEALRAKIEKVISEANVSQTPRGQGGTAAFQQILGMCFRASINSGN
tara:strand:- start:1643 stop:2386 length:744 start_codon:yes stop_codon:yes gene_type:complete